MTSLQQSYPFYNIGRIGADPIDNTQRNIENTKFANYNVSSFTKENLSNMHVDFAVSQPTVMFSSFHLGKGLPSSAVDYDTILTMKQENERPLEKLQLNTRTFVTVPYLGRGSCDCTLESQLQQGELAHEKKSISTIMEKSFIDYSMFPSDDKMRERVENTSHTIQESAMSGWVRGGAQTREYAQ
jgi:hypothetical protein